MQRSIDGFQTRGNQPARPIARPQTQAQPQPQPRPATVPPPSHATSRPIAPKPTLRERLQTPLIIFGGILAGLFSQSLWFGLAVVVIYGICTLIFRINSRTTFTLAFISLVTVVLLLLVRQDAQTASNFATYTFLLLVLGVIALSFEARPQRRKKHRNGR